jgi:nicotinamide-nucleotide amidase
VIPQTRGTAPGLICPVVVDGADKVVFAVPGVPHEMQDMFQRAIVPDLQRRSGDQRFVIASRVLRTWGESESGLNERLDGVIAELDRAGNPTLAFLASGWEGLKVRLTAKAADAEEAAGLIGEWERRLREELGELVFGADDDTMESVVLDLMRARGWSLGCAESVTGGLVGARLTAISGSSEVFRGSIVSYASEVKYRVLGVPEGPVVSEEAALAMAEGARRVLECDVALALTGVAGPREQDGMPVGTLCVGLVWPHGRATRAFRLPGQREQMRQFSVINSLDWLRRTLGATAGPPPVTGDRGGSPGRG